MEKNPRLIEELSRLRMLNKRDELTEHGKEMLKELESILSLSVAKEPSESDAILFAEWIINKDCVTNGTGMWVSKNLKMTKPVTTQQLYDLFKGGKTK